MSFRCPSCQPPKNWTHRPNDPISDLKQIISRQASIRNITDLLWLLQSLSRPNSFSLSQKPNFKDFPTELGWNIANYWKLLLHYKMTLYLNLFATFSCLLLYFNFPSVIICNVILYGYYICNIFSTTIESDSFILSWFILVKSVKISKMWFRIKPRFELRFRKL